MRGSESQGEEKRKEHDRGTRVSNGIPALYALDHPPVTCSGAERPMSTSTRDEKTTPQWARFPILTGFFGMAIYFLLCFHFALRSGVPDWSYFGGWKMFTTRDRYHAVLEADALIEGSWTELDLEALFPYRWDSGPRYARGPFRRNPHRLRVLAASTCNRAEEKPQAIRLRQIKWKKTLGQYEQPREEGLEEKTLLTWRCGQPVSLPNGRTLQ